MKDAAMESSSFVKSVLEKIRRTMKVDVLDNETTMTVERMVVLRLATKQSTCGPANSRQRGMRFVSWQSF